MVTTSEIIRKIEDYLAGKISREDAWKWASNTMHKTKHGELDEDDFDAILSLYGLHDEEERFRTAREDLEKTLKKLREKSNAK